MEHRVVIERIFSLGNYQNVKVTAETSSIPDEIWNDKDRLASVREALEMEVMATFSAHMLMRDRFADAVRSGDFETIYNETS